MRCKYVALLRGINVGGRTLRMASLLESLQRIGLEDARTYIQSGNVIFSSQLSAEQLRAAMEAQIAHDHELAVQVVLRTAAELRTAVVQNPFALRFPERELHLTLLQSEPSQTLLRALQEVSRPPDDFHVQGLHVYLHCPNGYGQTKLTNAFFERRLKVAATTRNWRSVQRLLALAQG